MINRDCKRINENINFYVMYTEKKKILTFVISLCGSNEIFGFIRCPSKIRKKLGRQNPDDRQSGWTFKVVRNGINEKSDDVLV